jgi:1-acyl-sn-glycerol-3-phosphate acyltransferase
VIVANHASYLDGLVLASALPDAPVFIAKRELATQLVAGPFLRARARCRRRGYPRRPFCAHREAPRLPSGRNVHARAGAARIPPRRLRHRGRRRIAVIPLAIRGTRSILRPDRWLPRRGRIAAFRAPAITPEGSGFAAALSLSDLARAAILALCEEPDLARV